MEDAENRWLQGESWTQEDGGRRGGETGKGQGTGKVNGRGGGRQHEGGVGEEGSVAEVEGGVGLGVGQTWRVEDGGVGGWRRGAGRGQCSS